MNPGPSLITASTEVLCSHAIFPSVANAKMPTSKLVMAFTNDTASTSCKKLLLYLLYDANEIIEPNAMPSELKFWAAALIHTLAFASSAQFGLKK